MSPTPPGSSSHDLPGPLSFMQVLVASGRLFTTRSFSLVGVFAVVFALAFIVGVAIDALRILPSNITIVFYELIIGIGGAFAVAYQSLLLADVVTDSPRDVATARATVRANSRELVSAGLLSALFILVVTMFGLGPVAVALLGPPLIVQAIVLEYRPFREAVAHVRDIATGRWARVSLILLGSAVAALVVQVLLWILITRPLVEADDDTVRAVLTLFGYVVRVLSAAFLCTVGFTLYLDVRARSQGLTFDVFVEERRNATVAPAPEGSIRD